MADVKSMLNKFEQIDNMSAGRGIKPTVAAKPVLQRFQTAAKENNASKTTSQSPSNPVLKSGHPPAVKLAGLTGGAPALKPTVANSSNERGGRLGGPKVFQNGQTTQDGSRDNNNDQAATKKAPWQKPKPPVSASTSSSSDDKPPVTLPKFPSMGASSQILTNNSPKQAFPSSKPDNDKDSEQPKANKSALIPKNFQNKTDSIRSTSSNSSSNSSSSFSSLSEARDVTSPVSPSPKSPPSSSSQSSTSGAFDFKSMLRKVDASISGPPGKRVLSGISNDSSSSESPNSKAPVSTTSSVTSTSSSSDIENTKVQSRVPPIPSKTVEMRAKTDRDSEDIVVRKSDGKRFRRMPPPSHKPPITPKKPAIPSNINLTPIRQQYQKLKSGPDANDVVPEEDDDDIYWEGETPNPAPVAPIPPVKPPSQSRESQRISLIPDMTAEEEEGDLPVYDDTPIEDDVYDDAMTERPNASQSKTSVSSEPTETDQDKKKRLKEEANAKKREEKEKREKEKREKEEEKKRKKKEEEEIRLKSKLNLTGQEKLVGEGVIKQDAKASGLNLKVKKGQIVTIVRLDSNPPNKWLVKADTQFGYVDSRNIEVDPNIIRQTMEANTEEEFDQPTYDDVPQEETGPSFIVPLEGAEEDDLDQIYEMCE